MPAIGIGIGMHFNRSGVSPVTLTIDFVATQLDFKFKLPSTKTVKLIWGDGTSEDVVGQDSTLITKTSAYAGAGTYKFSVTGDVLEITSIDVSSQAFVSGNASSWGSSLKNLIYVNISGTNITGITDVPVIILSGQSNAVGQTGAPVLSGLPSGWEDEQANIKIFWEGDYLTVNPANGAFVNMNPVENTRHPDYTDPINPAFNTVGWSIEQEWSHTLLNDYSNSYVIKSAYGGKKIDQWASPAGARWVELDRYITNGIRWLIANSLNPIFLGFAWTQGESDISGGTTQGDYETALTALISDTRGLSDYLTALQFYMLKIPTNFWGAEAICNTSYANIASGDSDSFVIETTQYSAGFDSGSGHYIASDLLNLGGDLYDAITHGLPLATNLELHYKAKNITNVSGNASDIFDVSGNIRDGSQAASGSRPSVLLADLNGYDALLFDGVDDFINSPDFSDTAPYTFYVVASIETDVSDKALFGNKTGGVFAAFWRNPSGNLGSFFGIARDVTTGIVTGTAFQCCWVTGGSPYNQVGAYNNTGANGSVTIDGICIGRYANSNAQAMNGKFYEVLIYNGAHDAPTRVATLAYLESKYNLP